MLNRLDPVLQKFVRKVEKSDSHTDIRKDGHDTSFGEKKDQNEQRERVPWEDYTIVSITALISFLEQILGIGIESSRSASTQQKTEVEVGGNDHNEPSPVMAKAIRAYGHGQQPIPKPSVHEMPSAHQQNASSDTELQTDLTKEDFEKIIGFLHELDQLQTDGVKELSLKRTATFLESIGDAIKEIKESM